MKKLTAVIIIPYVVVILITFYIYFGPGIFTGFETLKWNDLEIGVPKGYNVETYENQGWEVFSLRKIFEGIRLARKSSVVDVVRFPDHKHAGNVIYRYSPAPGSIYYISRVRKTHEVVYAVVSGDVTLHFLVATASVFSGTRLMEELVSGCFYKGQKIAVPRPPVPLGAYLTDFILLGGMILPLAIILLVFSLSAKKPKSSYFSGDPVQLEESGVYFTRSRRFQRKSSICYLVLTATRLIMFVFGKPSLEIGLHGEKPEIRFEKNKIVIQWPKEKIVLKPTDIEKWKNALSRYL